MRIVRCQFHLQSNSIIVPVDIKSMYKENTKKSWLQIFTEFYFSIHLFIMFMNKYLHKTKKWKTAIYLNFVVRFQLKSVTTTPLGDVTTF